MMKISNKVNFLKPCFLITRNKLPNINITFKYADWNVNLLLIFIVFMLVIYEIINNHKSKKNLSNSN